MSGRDAATAYGLVAHGVETFVRRRGDGPPVLLLHGNPDTGALWDGVVRHLRHRRTCWIPDIPGFGSSVAPRDWGYRLEDMAEWVGDLIDGLGIDDPLAVVGHDFGGIYALAYACRSPHRLCALGISGAPFFHDYRWHFWARVWRTPVLGELAAASLRWPIARWELKRGGPGLGEATIRAMYDAITPRTRRTILRLYRATDPSFFRTREEALPSLVAAVPTVILWGRADPYVPVALAARFGAREVHELDCGHWVPSERPEETAAILRTFLADSR